MIRLWKTALVVVFFVSSSFANAATARGRVFIGDQSCPAPYLTVRLSPPKNSAQSVIVTTTGADGGFAVNASDGTYYVEVDQFERQIYGHVLNVSSNSLLEIKLEAGSIKTVSCGEQAAAPVDLATHAVDVFRLVSSGASDWKPIDEAFDASTGLVVLDRYGRVTRVSQTPAGKNGDVLFELPQGFSPNVIGAGTGSIFVLATNKIGCTVFKYTLASKSLSNRLVGMGNEICTGIAADGPSVYIAFANVHRIKYWEDWQSGNEVNIEVDFSQYGGLLAVDRSSHKALLGDGTGNLFLIDPVKRNGVKVASFGNQPNGIGISSQYVIVVAGSKVISLSRSDLQKGKTPGALAKMPSGRFVGIAIDAGDKAWILDSQHDLLRGPLDLH